MAYTYAVSEFTDEKNVSWKVKIIDAGSGSDLNHSFTLGPNGFTLSYQYDNFDRCKAILGSKVSITLFHPDDNDTAFNNLYDKLNTGPEGIIRLEIYRDPDSDNELWWRGEVLAEQTVIPDEYPHAAVNLIAVDGLGNLKGIKYNDHGVAYEGYSNILEHLYNLLQKTHCADSYSSSDVFIRFYEDFRATNLNGLLDDQQLENARVHHESFYNKHANGNNEFYSCYDVLKSFAITFNATVFMAKGTFWFVPLGVIQNTPSADSLDTYYTVTANGTISYAGTSLADVDVEFGNNNNDFEKLAGWERSSVPAFKKVIRNRDYQGTRFLLGDSQYITEGSLLQDEDLNYATGDKFILTGEVHMFKEGDGPGPSPYIADEDRPQRLQIDFEIKVGDAGGTAKYWNEPADYPSNYGETVSFWDYSYATWPILPVISGYEDSYDTIDVTTPYYPGYDWSTAASTRGFVTDCWDAVDGTNVLMGMGNLPLVNTFQFISPGLEADAQGITLSATWKVVDRDGNLYTSSVGPTSTPDVRIKNLRISRYVDGAIGTTDNVDHFANNPNPSRFEFSQGTTLIGDAVSDVGLGNIEVWQNSVVEWQPATQWESIFSDTANLSINALGVRERLAANLKAVRSERGTLYKTGDQFLHPFNILENTFDNDNKYQLTGLTHIAARCEYDIECMLLERDETSITVGIENENNSGKGPGPITPVLQTKSSLLGNITTKAQNSFLKSESITTDTYGITDLKVSDGSSGTWDLGLPTSPPPSTQTYITVLRSDGNLTTIANGTAGQVLTVNAGATGALFQDATGESGWFNSTTLMKVMPTEFMGDSTSKFLRIDDGTTDEVSVICNDARTTFDVYAIKAIPTGYKATHVQVYGNNATSTSNCVTVRNYDHTDGDLTNTTSGNMNTNIDITDITSSATANILIKVTLTSTHGVGQDNLYGADITIAAV